MRAMRGFTLIELLVVIAIIGILATFLVANFNSAQQRARDAQRKNDLSQIQKAFELAKADTSGASYYPNTLASLGTDGYMRSVPTDPSTGAVYGYVPTPGDCETNSNCTGYTLTATLEVETDPSSTKSQTNCGVTVVEKAYTVCDPGGTSAPAPAATSTPTPTATPVPPAP